MLTLINWDHSGSKKIAFFPINQQTTSILKINVNGLISRLMPQLNTTFGYLQVCTQAFRCLHFIYKSLAYLQQ